MSGTPTLKKGLNQRQLRMIAMGGVIGAGLFMGSGAVIGTTGPAVFLTYALAGLLVIMVMRALAEMAVANPSTGSFADYARNALGNWAGFSVGWLYWYFWVAAVGFEAIAGADCIRFWIPEAPLWPTALVLLVAMTATNLFSVSSFGEFEYWFAGIKVAAIIVFLVIGTAFVFGLWPGRHMDVSHLTNNEGLHGFFPLGAAAVTVSVVTVIFSMTGAEIATIAAAESEDPEKAVTKAANSVIVRTLVFFVGSSLLLVLILPWHMFTGSGAKTSPFVAAFTAMGIPYANHIMNAVVLTAVLSCLNSAMYTASRMMFVLAARREAPPRLVAVTRRGVPAVAILASSVVGLVCVLGAALFPSTIRLLLLNTSGAVIIFVYLLIVISQIVLRYRNGSEGLKVKMWLFPVASIITALAMIAILVQMALTKGLREQLMMSLLAWGLVIVLFFANRWFISRRPIPEPVTATERPHRVLVLANETVGSEELLDELRSIGADSATTYRVVVPVSPIETGAAASHGPLDVWEATKILAQQRLDQTLAALHSANLEADGKLGDYRPLRALAAGVAEFHPDQIVIATEPPEQSIWHRFDVVDRARAEYHVPVTNVIAMAPAEEPVA